MHRSDTHLPARQIIFLDIISNNLPRLSLWIGFVWQQQQQQGAALCKKQVPQGTWIIAQPLLVTTAAQQAMSSVCAHPLQAGIQNENVEPKHRWGFPLGWGEHSSTRRSRGERGSKELQGHCSGSRTHTRALLSDHLTHISSHPEYSPECLSSSLVNSQSHRATQGCCKLTPAASEYQPQWKKSAFPNQDLYGFSNYSQPLENILKKNPRNMKMFHPWDWKQKRKILECAISSLPLSSLTLLWPPHEPPQFTKLGN